MTEITEKEDADSRGHNQLQYFILDVLQQGGEEKLDAIMGLLNDETHTFGWTDIWGKPFDSDEVKDTLCHMAREGLLEIKETNEECTEYTKTIDPASVDWARGHCTWFGPTPKGQEMWSRWDPPKVG